MKPDIPGQVNIAERQYITGDSINGANHIPGQSPYIASNAALNPRSTTSSPSNTPTTAACANGDLACKSGIGVQQSSVPELTQAARESIADTAATTSRQAGVLAAGATAVAVGTSPPIKPIATSVAVGTTAIGTAADAIEQVVRPDMEQIMREQLIFGTPADVLIRRYPLYAPLINEVKEALQ